MGTILIFFRGSIGEGQNDCVTDNSECFLDGVTLDCTWHKWKNHFCEMKGDVGMSVHETRRCLHQDTNSFITPSLHLCSEICLFALGKEKTSSH